jgi:hypothetical protein
MRISRIPSGRTLAILGAIGASLALGAPARAADPVTPIPPVHKVPAVVKHTPAPAHTQAQPLIPPAVLPGQVGEPPAPREPLPLETDLLPLDSAPAASTPPKRPMS